MKIAALLPSNPEQYQLSQDLNKDPVAQLIASFVQIALTVGGAIAVIYIIIGAYQYFTAFGSEEKATKAKTTITWAVIGVVVIILSKVVVIEVWNFISGSGAPKFWF